MSKSPSLRRIQADIRELALDPSDQYHASPLENDMFEWHFTIRGAKGTDFEGGIYHGRILLPPDYPFKPPHIMFLNKSGRFETNTKVCLSFSAYHPELWQPAWGIRLILEALISFLPTPADGAIGALDWSSKERQRLAKASVDFCCPLCGKVADLLPKPKEGDGSSSSSTNTSTKPSRFAKEIEELRRLQMVEHQKIEEEPKQTEIASAKQQEAEPESEKDEPPTKMTTKETTKSNTTDIETDSKQAPSLEQGNEGEPSPADAVLEDAEPINQPPRMDPVPEPPAVVAAPLQDRGVPVVAPQVNSGVWWLLDPLLQLIIVILSAICFLLMRKVQALVEDLQALEDE